MLKVAVLDSRVDLSHPVFKDKKVSNCMRFSDSYNESNVCHGTAVCGIIANAAPKVEIVCFPIFDEHYEAEPDKVISVLQYILEDKSYNVVNMSMGFFDPSYKSRISDICSQLKSMGILLVASFDNWGSMSYPACLDLVIGVDVSDKIDLKESFFFNEKGCVNVIFPDKQRRVAWGDGKYRLVRGTSFAAAEVTGLICSYLTGESGEGVDSITDYLCMKSSKIIEIPYEKNNIKPEFAIGKAALFPYCKETVSIIKSMNYLCCDLIGLYDYRFSNHIGASIETLNENKVITVESEKKIPWNLIDTLIVGYTAENNAEVRGLFYSMLDIAMKHNVNIYSLGELPDRYMQAKSWYPQIDYSFLPKTQQGKMWPIEKPVLAIVGTSSRIGKFTTQIALSQALRDLSYSVGMITTEPTGYLFGADYVFPYGYKSTVDLKAEEYSLAINKMLYLMTEEKDIITISLQGGTIHLNTGNINQLSIKQHSILFGTYVDIAVLCVNVDDDETLISSIISYLSVCFNIHVVCILIYPIAYRGVFSDDIDLKEIIVTQQEMKEKEELLSKQFKRPALEMNKENIFKAVQMIIKELSGED